MLVQSQIVFHSSQNRTSLSSSFSLCQGWAAARNFFTASSDSLFHPPLCLVLFFQSSSSPGFLTSLLTQSSHLSLGLPRLLLPCSHNSAALFGSLSSAILSTCPAHCSLLLTSLSVKLLCTPVSSLNTTILLLSALLSRDVLLASCQNLPRSCKFHRYSPVKIWLHYFGNRNLKNG